MSLKYCTVIVKIITLVKGVSLLTHTRAGTSVSVATAKGVHFFGTSFGVCFFNANKWGSVMSEFVKCWHCKHYIWFSVTDDNFIAHCEIKNQSVFKNEKVCESFILSQGIFTRKEIPEYCIYYKNKGT